MMPSSLRTDCTSRLSTAARFRLPAPSTCAAAASAFRGPSPRRCLPAAPAREQKGARWGRAPRACWQLPRGGAARAAAGAHVGQGAVRRPQEAAAAAARSGAARGAARVTSAGPGLLATPAPSLTPGGASGAGGRGCGRRQPAR